MKVVLVGILLALSSLNALAADSTWLVCKNKSLVVNVFEHRTGAESRVTDLMLIYGNNQFFGEGNGQVYLVGTPEDINDYIGTLIVDFTAKTASLKGTLDLDGSAFAIDTKLKCSEMNSSAL